MSVVVEEENLGGVNFFVFEIDPIMLISTIPRNLGPMIFGLSTMRGGI